MDKINLAILLNKSGATEYYVVPTNVIDSIVSAVSGQYLYSGDGISINGGNYLSVVVKEISGTLAEEIMQTKEG